MSEDTKELPGGVKKPAAKRKPPAAGIGRKKGVPNKTTRLLKEAILKAAEAAGEKHGPDGMVSYLTHQAEKNPGPFLALLGKVLPMTVVGDADNPLVTKVEVEFVRPEGSSG